MTRSAGILTAKLPEELQLANISVHQRFGFSPKVRHRFGISIVDLQYSKTNTPSASRKPATPLPVVCTEPVLLVGCIDLSTTCHPI